MILSRLLGEKLRFFGIKIFQPLDKLNNFQVVIYKSSMVWHDVAHKEQSTWTALFYAVL